MHHPGHADIGQAEHCRMEDLRGCLSRDCAGLPVARPRRRCHGRAVRDFAAAARHYAVASCALTFRLCVEAGVFA